MVREKKMFLLMIFTFILGVIFLAFAIKEGMRNGIGAKLVIAAAIGIIFIIFSVYLALPHIS